MHFENIVCNGAKKGIFIRGLPEMTVQNIRLSDCVLNAEIGAELIDAANISLDKVQLNSRKTDPVVSMENSFDIRFGALSYPADTKLLLKVSGPRSKNIDIRKLELPANTDKILVTGEAATTSVIRN
jgi:hypothetical protein